MAEVNGFIGEKGLENIISTFMRLFHARSASIMLPDENGNLKIRASYGIDQHVFENTCVEGTCSRGYGSNSYCVYATGEPRLVRTEDGIVGVGYQSNSMCLPVCYNGNVIGVLNISNKEKEFGNFTEAELKAATNSLKYCALEINQYYTGPARMLQKLEIPAHYPAAQSPDQSFHA